MAVNLAELLTSARQEAPDAVALVEAETGREVTWAELDAEVDRVAQGLSELGLVAGYRVMIALTNRVEFFTTYLAVLRARLVAVPVNPRSATGELVRMMADSGARAVFADSTTVTGVRSASAGLHDALMGADEELKARAFVPHVVTVGVPSIPGETTYDALGASVHPTAVTDAQDPEALAVLLYTSGTSGRPRAAMLTHRALLANLEQGAQVSPPAIGPGDVVYGVLPMFHVYGLNAVFGSVLWFRARLVLANGFDVEGSLDTIEDLGVTVVPVAPPVFAYWRGVDDLAARLSGVRLMLSGSAPLDPELVTEFTARTGKEVHQGYGLTEAAPVVTSTLVSRTPKAGSVGAALPGIEIRLVDEQGHQPDGEDPGEIEIRGANLFSGYWPDGADGPGADGWYATGDVGFLDPDGDLFLVDRLKELVIVSGFNVYPVEIEEVILDVEGVAEAAVIGTPDPATGEAVVAFVVPSGDTLRTPAEIEAAVRDRCMERLARFKQPKEINVVDELPHTGTGKVAKGRLRAVRRRQNLGLLE
ncbi:MAG TPA: class I adenylate-forming enzyme family protein [Nocardioidaceae bacterium]|nr:class I adenylate-forming enzyme family protein [Nocardioidaceae bacterium]